MGKSRGNQEGNVGLQWGRGRVTENVWKSAKSVKKGWFYKIVSL